MPDPNSHLDGPGNPATKGWRSTNYERGGKMADFAPPTSERVGRSTLPNSRAAVSFFSSYHRSSNSGGIPRRGYQASPYRPVDCGCSSFSCRASRARQGAIRGDKTLGACPSIATVTRARLIESDFSLIRDEYDCMDAVGRVKQDARAEWFYSTKMSGRSGQAGLATRLHGWRS